MEVTKKDKSGLYGRYSGVCQSNMFIPCLWYEFSKCPIYIHKTQSADNSKMDHKFAFKYFLCSNLSNLEWTLSETVIELMLTTYHKIYNL